MSPVSHCHFRSFSARLDSVSGNRPQGPSCLCPIVRITIIDPSPSFPTPHVIDRIYRRDIWAILVISRFKGEGESSIWGKLMNHFSPQISAVFLAFLLQWKDSFISSIEFVAWFLLFLPLQMGSFGVNNEIILFPLLFPFERGGESRIRAS